MRALLLTAWLAPLAAADESYTIKIKRFPDAGKSVTVRKTARTTTSTKITDAAGKVGKVNMFDVLEEEYTETILEAGDKAPRKFKRFYRKSRLDKGKGSTVQPREGKVVLFELKDGKYRVSVEGKGELPAEEREKLGNEAEEYLKEGIEAPFVPARAVKVGDTWAVPVKKLGGPEIIDPVRSKSEVKLVKAYKKGGRQWGVLQMKFLQVMRSLDKGGPELAGPVEGEVIADTPIDGSSTAGRWRATMTYSVTLRLGERGMRQTIETKGKTEGTIERVEER
jgi:hypothetical protein